MYKLIGMKDWVTVEAATTYLSNLLKESVTEADVLQLALDGHLKLSVNFVKQIPARCGKFNSWEDTEWKLVPRWTTKAPPGILGSPEIAQERRGYPPKLLSILGEFDSNDMRDYELDVDCPVMTSLKIDSDRYITLEDRVISIRGVWDLPMIGNEKLDIERRCHRLSGGKAITLPVDQLSAMATYVESATGEIFQIQHIRPDRGSERGPDARLRLLKRYIANNNIVTKQAEAMLKRHEKAMEVNSKPPYPEDSVNLYDPALELPEDGILVVRTAALQEFVEAMNSTPVSEEKPIGTTERNSLLIIIAALCDYSDIDLEKRGTAAQIEQMTEEIGAKVDEDTVYKVLKKITDALEARRK